MARAVDRKVRRAELVAAASDAFAERGVANTPVSEIVKAAGVAQGTFYLYFKSKDEIVLAVVERLAATMAESLRKAVALPGASAVEELRALCDALGDLTTLPGAAELIELMHGSENRAIHDRLVEQFAPKLVPILLEVIEHGVSQGVFSVPDPLAAAWYVLAGLQSVELSRVPLEEMPQALTTASDLALRVLGHMETPA